MTKKHAFLLKNHVKFLTKLMNFTKLNNFNMVEMHVNHGFRHVGQNQKNCYILVLVHLMNCII